MSSQVKVVSDVRVDKDGFEDIDEFWNNTEPG
jgi:hypothetical protein